MGYDGGFAPRLAPSPMNAPITVLPVPPVQELSLADDLFAGLFSQAKRVTVRARHRAIRAGELVFRGAFDETLTTRVTVTEVIHTTLGAVSEEDARADGYFDVREMVRLMRRFYPDITGDSPVTLLRFTVLDPLTADLAERLARVPAVPADIVV